MFEVVSNDTGWTSGRLELRNGTQICIPLTKDGNNSFRIEVYDKLGKKIPIPEQRITITKVPASVGAIPASHSIAVSALDRIGGTERLVYLVRKDESLPKKGSITFRAAQTLKASADESLNFNLWEGEIETPYYDNRFAGVYSISSGDLSGNEIIPAGSEILCSYEISDGGAISMSASVPCIGRDFTGKNLYSHYDAKLDLQDTARLAEEGRDIVEQIDEMSQKIDDPNLDKAREKAEHAVAIEGRISAGIEEVQEAYSDCTRPRRYYLRYAVSISGKLTRWNLRNVQLSSVKTSPDMQQLQRMLRSTILLGPPKDTSMKPALSVISASFGVRSVVCC